MTGHIFELLKDPAVQQLPALQDQLIKYIERSVTIMNEATRDLVISVARMQLT